MTKVPTTELFKEGCRIVANDSDVPFFVERGWKLKTAEGGGDSPKTGDGKKGSSKPEKGKG